VIQNREIIKPTMSINNHVNFSFGIDQYMLMIFPRGRQGPFSPVREVPPFLPSTLKENYNDAMGPWGIDLIRASTMLP
jgi:hypothetical protein